jgi:hypothetical protein
MDEQDRRTRPLAFNSDGGSILRSHEVHFIPNTLLGRLRKGGPNGRTLETAWGIADDGKNEKDQS